MINLWDSHWYIDRYSICRVPIGWWRMRTAYRSDPGRRSGCRLTSASRPVTHSTRHPSRDTDFRSSSYR